MARSMGRNIPDRMEEALRKVEGAFSIVAMTPTKLMGVRDPLGVRPLVLGKLGDGWALSSETCALDIIGPRFVRDLDAAKLGLMGAKRFVDHHAHDALRQRFRAVTLLLVAFTLASLLLLLLLLLLVAFHLHIAVVLPDVRTGH